MTSEQIEAEICGIIRDVAHKHGAEVTFDFNIEQRSEYGLSFAARYDVAWKYRRHMKFCLRSMGTALAVHFICSILFLLKIAPEWAFWITAVTLFTISLSSMIYARFFAPKLANPDRIYREARSLVRKKFGKTYNAGLNDLT